MRDVYIVSTGRFLPGAPISNQEIEHYIGKIHGKSSRLHLSILRKNGIETRHYAISVDGKITHSNAQMAASAIKQALETANIDKNSLDYLATSTTQGDLLVPGFASNVHAELKANPLEIASFQSVCASSLMAVKSAYLNIKANEAKFAAVSGSEFSSRWFRPGKYEEYISTQGADKPPIESEFLRWTLSDGAGAVILSDKRKEGLKNLKINWIELKSYADKFPPCMYAGMNSNRGKQKAWGEYNSTSDAEKDGSISLKQDVELLYQLFPVWMGFYLELIKKYKLDATKIDYFLPHYSSESLGREMKKHLQRTGTMIPEEKWFNNLKTFGNTGSASIFIMLDDFIKIHPVKAGEKILCFVPESGQCIASFMMLTVM